MRALLLVGRGDASTATPWGMAAAVLSKSLYWNVITARLYSNVNARSTGMS
jgi:hypothetical protein